MPRQLDTAPQNLAIANNPTVTLGVTPDQITNLFGNLPQLSLQAIETAINQLLGYVDQVTGLNLLAFAKAVEGIDFSSPTAFLESLAAALISIGTGLLTAASPIFSDLLSLLGDPLGLGTGSPTLPGIGNIPLLGGLLSEGETLLNSLIPGLDATKIISGLFPQNMVSGLGGDLSSIFTTLTSPFSAALLQNVPLTSVGLVNPELLANPNYSSADAVVGGTVWTFDPAVSHTADGSGSVKVNANGTILQLLSDPAIPVSPNQTLSLSHWLMWSGLAGTGVCLSLGLVAYNGTTISNTVDLQDITNPAISSGWVKLSGTYTVPATAVDSIRLQLTVTSAATAGAIWWDDGSVKKTQLLAQSWTAGLPGDISNLLTQINARTLITDFTGLLTSLGLGSPTLTAITDRFANLSGSGTFNAAQLFNIANIPQLLVSSVAGIGGLPNIGATLQQTWDTIAGAGTGLGSPSLIDTRLGNISSGGLFDASQLANMLHIPLLPGASVPVLDATKIASGVLGLAQIPTSLFGLGNIGDLQTLTNYITSAFNPGGAGRNTALSDALGAMGTLFNTTVANTQAVANLAQTTSGATNSGISATINFANYADGPQLPADQFNPTTYSGSGTSRLGVRNGATAWYLNNDGARIGTAHHNTPTQTDYQRITSTVNLGPGGASSGYLTGRCNAADNSFVYVKITSTGFLSYAAELGCFVGGVKTVWIPATAIPAAYTATFVVGTAVGLRNYQLFVGTKLVFNHVEVGTASQVGPANRFWGVRGETNGADAPPNTTNLGVSDNQPPSTIGSFFRQYRANTGNVGVPGGFAIIAANFFDTVDQITEDFDFTPGNNALTVGFEGTYYASLRYAINNLPFNGKFDPTLYKNGQMVRRGNGAFADSGSLANSPSGVGTGFVIYCRAGDVLQPGFWSGGNFGSLLTGEPSGTASYFEVGLLNRSLA